jgi:pheromone shutdown protein TraB
VSDRTRRGQGEATCSDPDHWKHMDIVQVIKSGKIYLLFSSILLSIFQKKMGDRLTSAPGDEFKKRD